MSLIPRRYPLYPSIVVSKTICAKYLINGINCSRIASVSVAVSYLRTVIKNNRDLRRRSRKSSSR